MIFHFCIWQMLWPADNDEKRIFRGVAKGDKQAMRELYDLVAGSISSACCRYVANDDDAKDVAQDTFLSIITHIGDFEYRGKGSLRAWATRIAINKAVNFMRKQDRQLLSVKEELLSDKSLNAVEVESNLALQDLYDIDADQLHAFIRSLPDGYRTVFNLYAIDGKSHSEIAQLLGISESTSASQYHRAKVLLAKKITNYLSQKSTSYEY